MLVVVAGGLAHRRGLIWKPYANVFSSWFCIFVLLYFFQLKQPGLKTISWRGSLPFDSLPGPQWCCSILCGQWTRRLQLTVSSEATLQGKDATRPRKGNQERWMGWATFDPTIRTAVSIILSHRSVHDSGIICFSLSDLHAVVSRRSVLLLHHWFCLCHAKKWLFQEVKQDSFLSFCRQLPGIVKSGTGQFTLAEHAEVS